MQVARGRVDEPGGERGRDVAGRNRRGAVARLGAPRFYHGANITHLAYSPDGKLIAYQGNSRGNFGIYVVAEEGGKPKLLTSHEKDETNPRWSPDGKHIAFSTNWAGKSDIWVVPFEEGEPVRLNTLPWDLTW